MAQSFPYSDEYMRYDYATHRYVLTLKYVTDVLGIDIQRRVSGGRAVVNQAVINSMLNTASLHVYNYIFNFNSNRRAQQWIIAKCPSAREIIKDAMAQQLAYLMSVGDLTRSPKEEDRIAYMDMQAKIILDQTVNETGVPLTSIMAYRFCPPDYKEGGY